MKRQIGLSFCLACCMLLQGCTPQADKSGSSIPPSSSSSSEAAASPLRQKLERMTVEEKIGQMVLAGIDGYESNPQTEDLIQNRHVGGIIFYKTNVRDSGQLVQLVNSIKQANSGNPAPIWLSADEEGGKVTRLPGEIVKTPANKVIGAADQPQLSYGIGKAIGNELRAFGLNVDFAPVLDINSNPQNPVIGERSFGADAAIVTSLGVQTMKGLQDSRVMPVIKHFPGHGDTSVDSHVGLPVVQSNLDRLRRLELVPFAEAIKQQADAVMVAHILLPRIDSKNPASFSKTMITDLLRGELGFKGVVITDDMTMGAVVNNYEIGEAAVQSVLAGADVILVGHDYDKVVHVVTTLHQAVQDHRIPMETIDQSVTRILQMKEKYEWTDEPVQAPDAAKLNRDVQQLLDAYLPKQK